MGDQYRFTRDFAPFPTKRKNNFLLTFLLLLNVNSTRSS